MQITQMPSGMLSVNTYYVVDETTGKAFIVDPGGWSQRMKEHVLGSDAELEYIILTHGHSDHIMGVPALLKDIPGAKVVACVHETQMLGDADLNMSRQFGQPTRIHPDITVDDGDTMTVGSLKLQFLFTPGHSPGGMCIYIPQGNTCFSGDTLFQSSIGRTDFIGSSFKKLADSIHTKLWTLPDSTEVYPGHMGPTTIGYEKEHNPFV